MKRGWKIAAVLWLAFLETAGVASAQSVYEDYIHQYSALAISQQEEFGIPASITLAQGILESGAGRSRLATEGNNHFGIKCHKEWEGPTMLKSDDAPDECFRVYSNPEESYRDHSLFLCRPRYESLYLLEVTDYAGWARGLKKCGYATDPNYAARLITIIERYGLYDYDTEAGRKAEETVMFIRNALASSHPLRKSRGLHYVVAVPGDTYESIAKEFNMNVKKLRKFNDADKKTAIKEWEEVYLEEKHSEGPENVKTATIGEGESLHSLSQRYGIKLSSLKDFNKDIEDKPGMVIRLHR